MMHRANLQRVDRCSMHFQLEIREPFLDQTVVSYAAALDRSDLLRRSANAAPVGKAPLRALYDLYPTQLPIAIRDREKMLFNEGADGAVERSGWLDLFEQAISDKDFGDGQRQFAAFGIATKEELFYMRARRPYGREPHSAFARPAPPGYASGSLIAFVRCRQRRRRRLPGEGREVALFKLCRGDQRRCRG